MPLVAAPGPASPGRMQAPARPTRRGFNLPHPEEPAEGGRLEGWAPPWTASWFETRRMRGAPHHEARQAAWLFDNW